MADGWVSTTEGAHLKGRRKRDTEPELALRRTLHRRGLRYRVHVRLARGCTPDILFRRARLAIFVDGCYWHQCPRHGRTAPFTGPNAALWAEKFCRNRERDTHATSSAELAGFRVLRVWECDICADAEAVADVVAQQLEGRTG